PDLEDMFYAPYPLGRTGATPAINDDPGRVRYQPLFARMYGDCTKGEAARLQKVSDELDTLPAEMTKYLVPSAGTFNCRVVAGTNRMSAHGLGIAIDIATTL